MLPSPHWIKYWCVKGECLRRGTCARSVGDFDPLRHIEYAPPKTGGDCLSYVPLRGMGVGND